MALNPSTGWAYYKQLDITDSANVSANYQMKLTVYSGTGTDNPSNGEVYCDNHCENFPDDIRFGTTNNPSTATQLSQWIEEYDATQAIIWVKLPSDGSDTIYMFIGNSAASQYSSGSDTFIFFESWDTDYTSSYTSVQRTDGKYGWGRYRSISNVSIPYRQIFKVRINTWDYGNYGSEGLQGTAADTTNASPNNGIYTVWCCDTDVGASSTKFAWKVASRVSGTGYSSSYHTVTFTTSTWFKNEICVTSSEITANLYSNDYSSTLASDTLSNVPSTTGAYNYYGEETHDTRSPGYSWAYHGSPDYCIGYGGYRGSLSHIELYTPWVFIAKYSSTEPTWDSFGDWTQVTTANIAVSTLEATNIGKTYATLNGSLDKMEGVSQVNVWFEWGLTTSYGNSTPTQTLTSTGTFSYSLTGLSPSTTYHFRARAQEVDGTTEDTGDDKSFTTASMTIFKGYNMVIEK